MYKHRGEMFIAADVSAYWARKKEVPASVASSPLLLSFFFSRLVRRVPWCAFRPNRRRKKKEAASDSCAYIKDFQCFIVDDVGVLLAQSPWVLLSRVLGRFHVHFAINNP